MRKELSMIYVTGDTHANIDIAKLNTTKFPQQKELTKNDFVIICGDFGLCWDGSHREMWWQDWLTAKNFTTLWIDGNHENFDRLYSNEFETIETNLAERCVKSLLTSIIWTEGRCSRLMERKSSAWAVLALLIKSIAWNISHGGKRKCRPEKKWNERLQRSNKIIGELTM